MISQTETTRDKHRDVKMGIRRGVTVQSVEFQRLGKEKCKGEEVQRRKEKEVSRASSKSKGRGR